MPTLVGRTTAATSTTKAKTTVSVSSNDPVLKIRKSGSEFTVSGTATNSGTKPSRITAEVGGKLVSVPLSRGVMPAKAVRALAAAMPKGWKLKETWATDHIGGPVGFQIKKAGKAPKPASPSAGSVTTAGTPPLWYLKWKFIGTAPPKDVSGTFHFGETVVKVANGKVTKVNDGIVQVNGKAVVVSGGKVVGAQG